MKTESATDILARDILLLAAKRETELEILKEQVHVGLESLKPMNLLKNTFKNLTHSTNIKDGLGKAAIGVTAGFLLKKLVFGPSVNPIKNLAGAAFQTLVTNVATRNSDKIKERSFDFFKIAKAFMTPKKKIVME